MCDKQEKVLPHLPDNWNGVFFGITVELLCSPGYELRLDKSYYQYITFLAFSLYSVTLYSTIDTLNTNHHETYSNTNPLYIYLSLFPLTSLVR